MKNRIFRKFEWSTWKLLDFRILLQIPQTPCRKSTSLRELRDRYASRRTHLWKFLPTVLLIIQIYITNLFIYIWIFRKIDIQLKSLCFIYIGVLITSLYMYISVFKLLKDKCGYCHYQVWSNMDSSMTSINTRYVNARRGWHLCLHIQNRKYGHRSTQNITFQRQKCSV